MQAPTRLFDFIYYQNQNYPQEKAYAYRRNGEWKYFSTQEAIAIAGKVSAGLLELGLRPGDKVAVITYQNRPEWVFLDIGLQQLGIINVPVYPTISSAEYEYIFKESEVSYCFVGGGDLYDKVAQVRDQLPHLKEIYTFDQVEGRSFWEEIFRSADWDVIEEHKDKVKEEDLATIIYTSGTTGVPKGVMLSHRNIVSNTLTVTPLVPIDSGDRVLSFLPLCHIFERTATYMQTFKGASVYYTSVDNLGGEDGDIQAVKPHFFNTVPRLLEKVYEKIYAKGDELTGVKRKLFFWALKLTEDYEYDKEFSGVAKAQRYLADRLIFSKWRAALGGNVRGILSGAAPLPARIARVFSAAGIPIREGYGLTETSPGICVGRYEYAGARIGTIGPVLEEVEIHLDASDGNYQEGEGEILVKGPNVMMGYYKQPEKTAEVFKEIEGETWFKTGDIGKLLPGPEGQRYLKITDRKKELLKTSGGKYIAPAPIENRFRESFLIEQMMVIGDKRKFASALIVPAIEALQSWCARQGLSWTSLGEMLKKPEVLKLYEQEVESINQEFSNVEKIKKFSLLPDSWLPTHPNGEPAELTPTMKLKRRVILEKYAPQIEAMYG